MRRDEGAEQSRPAIYPFEVFHIIYRSLDTYSSQGHFGFINQPKSRSGVFELGGTRVINYLSYDDTIPPLENGGYGGIYIICSISFILYNLHWTCMGGLSRIDFLITITLYNR